METSAKSSINVEEAFFTLARDIKAKMDRKLVRYFLLFLLCVEASQKLCKLLDEVISLNSVTNS